MNCKLRRVSLLSLATIACGVGVYLLVNSKRGPEKGILLIESEYSNR